MWRVLHTLELKIMVSRIMGNWLPTPLDYDCMVTQRLEAQGNVIRTLAHRRTSPLAATVRQYTCMMTEPSDSGPLKSLIFHFGGGICKW